MVVSAHGYLYFGILTAWNPSRTPRLMLVMVGSTCKKMDLKNNEAPDSSEDIPSLQLIARLLKINGWTVFRGHVSIRECISHEMLGSS